MGLRGERRGREAMTRAGELGHGCDEAFEKEPGNSTTKDRHTDETRKRKEKKNYLLLWNKQEPGE